MSMRSRLFARIVLIVGYANLLAATPAFSDNSTTFIIVRHAEKATDASTAAGEKTDSPTVFNAKDPPLSALGLRHADALKVALQNAPLYAVYATPFQRTQATAAPSANAHRLKISTYAAAAAAEFAQQLRATAKPGAVLIVAHSNTVGDIVAALCMCKAPLIGEQDFGDRFDVKIKPGGTTTLTQLRF
jgi:broad specificity phosphatase PhoE